MTGFDPVPKTIDFGRKLFEVARIVDDEVGYPSTIATARLGVHSGSDGFAFHPPRRHHALDREFFRRIDDDDPYPLLMISARQQLASRKHQQWNVVNDDRIGFGNRIDEPGRFVCDGRMHDCIECIELVRVAKDNVPHGSTVQRTILQHDFGTPTINHCVEH